MWKCENNSIVQGSKFIVDDVMISKTIGITMIAHSNKKYNLKLQEERRSGAPYLLDPLPKRSAPPTRGTLNSSIILMEVKTTPLSLLMCLYMALYLYRICIVFVFFGLFLCFVFVSSTLFNRKILPQTGELSARPSSFALTRLVSWILSHRAEPPLRGRCMFPSFCQDNSQIWH